jgi:beta-glucosidase-like glycosyl hydrolase
MSPFRHLDERDIDTPATRALNLEAAQQSMVLLKNDAPSDTMVSAPLLPLSSTDTVALIGPHFNR